MYPTETVFWTCALVLLIIDYGRLPGPVQGTSIRYFTPTLYTLIVNSVDPQLT